MTTASEPSSKGSRIKDVAIAAAVASVVSALVTPWLRRWMDAGGLGFGPPLQPQQALMPGASMETGQASDDLEARLDRLLDVPDPFARASVSGRGTPRGWGNETNRRNDVDDEDEDEDDLEP